MAATGVAAATQGAVAGMPAPTDGIAGDGSAFPLWELPWQRPESQQQRRVQSPACRLPQIK